MYTGAPLSLGLIQACHSGLVLYSTVLSHAGSENDAISAISERSLFIHICYFCRRYVPALSKMPLRYLFCPWKAPKDVQKEAGCIIGEDYPAPMVDHMAAWRQCKAWMEKVKVDLKNDSGTNNFISIVPPIVDVSYPMPLQGNTRFFLRVSYE